MLLLSTTDSHVIIPSANTRNKMSMAFTQTQLAETLLSIELIYEPNGLALLNSLDQYVKKCPV
jgi:hypothetical protein